MDPESLARLWQIGSETDSSPSSSSSEEEMAALLNDRLAEKLSFSPSTKTSPWKKTDELRSVLLSLIDRPIGAILDDPNADLPLLGQIKNHGRALSECAVSDAEHRTANVIYYAAIARALMLHGEKITSYAWSNLTKSFKTLSRIGWLTPKLTELFEEACDYCQSREEPHGRK